MVYYDYGYASLYATCPIQDEKVSLFYPRVASSHH